MSKIYCGNNSENSNLKNGTQQIGTRYGCLRKGIGKGLHEPKDPSYTGRYSPIDKRKVYCGKAPSLPENYDLLGNLPQCLQKGIGIGKRKKASQFLTYITKNNHILIGGLLVLIIIFILLLTLKPNCVSRVDKNNVKHIDIPRFALVYSIICIGVLLIIYLYRQ